MLTFLLALLTTDADAATAGFGRLDGVVTSQADGRGQPNVTVIVRSARTATAEAGPFEPRVDTTDRDGTFSFDELPPGLYALDVIGAVHDAVSTSRLPSLGTSTPKDWVWAEVAGVIVVPGLTATERVVLGPPSVPPVPPEPASSGRPET